MVSGDCLCEMCSQGSMHVMSGVCARCLNSGVCVRHGLCLCDVCTVQSVCVLRGICMRCVHTEVCVC